MWTWVLGCYILFLVCCGLSTRHVNASLCEGDNCMGELENEGRSPSEREDLHYTWPVWEQTFDEKYDAAYYSETVEKKLLQCRKVKESGLWGFFEEYDDSTVLLDSGVRQWRSDSECVPVSVQYRTYIECDEEVDDLHLLCEGENLNETLIETGGHRSQGCQTADIVSEIYDMEDTELYINSLRHMCKNGDVDEKTNLGATRPRDVVAQSPKYASMDGRKEQKGKAWRTRRSLQSVLSTTVK
eukprot:scaffold101_cov123-Cylindrotheca_fusiformis.AAC.15